jgi:hypothetical protein
MTPTPYPDYGVHIPTAPMTKVDWLLAAFMALFAIVSYWLPTILAIWRRNSRMGLVIFYNLGAFLVLPWFGAMTVVLGEHSHRPRRPSPAVPWSAPTPEQTAATPPPADLPANVTQLRPAGESEMAKARRLMRDWGRQ